MSNDTPKLDPTREQLFDAIRRSWSAETCWTPEKWSPENPSFEQCDVSAFVAWEYLGGDLVLGQVTLGGTDAGYHYWNRIDGADLDLTKSQFVNGESIEEINVLTDSYLQANATGMKPEVRERIALMSEKVRTALAAN